MVCSRRLLFVAAFVVASLPAGAQTSFDSAVITGPRWRMIGPFRGGRVKTGVGVPSQPNVFYMGMVNGGVWKTTDYGRVWTPIFDDEPTNSIGAIDVAVSNPNIVYVGTGEGLHRPDLATGDGIYKSSDAGKTWSHVWDNLNQQIGRIAIDPKNADHVFAAVLGHPYGPNPERGIYRTTDGGRTWSKVLYKDEYVGGADVVIDPVNSNVVYAAMWDAQYGPWESGTFIGTGSGLFKSTDGGNSWKQLTKGLPTPAEGLSRIDIAIAPSNPNRLFIVAGTGRSAGCIAPTMPAKAGPSPRRTRGSREVLTTRPRLPSIRKIRTSCT